VTRAPRHLLLLAALVLLALAWGDAAAATPFQVIKDCNQDGVLNGKYSNRDLRKALDNLPTDIDEYSDCRDVITAAITSGSTAGDPGAGGGAGSPGGGDPNGGGSPAVLTPEEQAARQQDQQDLAAITSPEGRDDGPSVEVGEETVKPGSNGLFDLANASNSLPFPLLLVLIVLGLLALGGGFVALRERVPALARIPLLSKLPTPRVSLPRFGRR
jgi:hypothetical protein